MTLFTQNPYSRVMVFIDYRNILEGTQFVGGKTELDIYRLTQILVGKRDLVGAYVFDARFKDYEDRESVKEHEKLSKQGFRVIVRDSVVYNGEKLEQKEVDVSLACEMVEHALLNHYDTAIVVSGDRDFVPAMQKVQSAGKTVEVAAPDNVYSDECKKTADVYYVLDDIPIMGLHSPPDVGAVL